MSPISPLVLQRQLRTLGKIRTGNQQPGRGGRMHPAKLDTFRFTSESEPLILAAREAFGGNVVPWANPATGKAGWEVITTTDAVDIVVPPGNPVTQWMELWRAGGCLRRCDGITERIGKTTCLCPQDIEQRVAMAAEGDACQVKTRLSVLLPQLPDLGVWLLETNSYYAATELAGTAEILMRAAENGRLIPARLRLDQREKKVPGQPTRQFAVPIIELVDVLMADMALTEGPGPAQLGPGRAERPLLPATLPPASSDMRAPTPVPDGGYATLTPDDFRRLIDEAGISVDAAYARAADLFPERPQGSPLTSVQLAALWTDLSTQAAATA